MFELFLSVGFIINSYLLTTFCLPFNYSTMGSDDKDIPVFLVQGIRKYNVVRDKGLSIYSDMLISPIQPTQFNKQYNISNYRYMNKLGQVVNQGIATKEWTQPFQIYSPIQEFQVSFLPRKIQHIIKEYIGSIQSLQDYEVILSTCPVEHSTDNDFSFHHRFTTQNNLVPSTYGNMNPFHYIIQELEEIIRLYTNNTNFHFNFIEQRDIFTILHTTPSSRYPPSNHKKIKIARDKNLFLAITKYPPSYYQDPTKQDILNAIPSFSFST